MIVLVRFTLSLPSRNVFKQRHGRPSAPPSGEKFIFLIRTRHKGDYAAGSYDFSLLAKWDFIKSISVVSDAFGGEIKVIPSGNYESADWAKYSVNLEATRSFVDSELTIIVKGIEGDFMIDHILLTSSLNTSGCREIINLNQ